MRVEGIDPNSLHEEKDPFFIAVTKAPEEKEVLDCVNQVQVLHLAFPLLTSHRVS